MAPSPVFRVLPLAVALLLSTSRAYAQSVYYVRPYIAPSGGPAEHRSGTSERDAFATLEEARDAVRARPDASIRGDIVVKLLPGTYRLARPVVFDNRDAGRNGHRVIYQAADPKRPPVLSGGVPVRGPWRSEGNGVFSADVGSALFRQLTVRGRWCVLAREPNAGAPGGAWRQLKQWEDPYGSKSVRLKGAANLNKEWKRPEQIQMVVKYHWAMARLHLGWWGTFDGDNVLFPPEQNIWSAIAPRENDQFYYLADALEFLDKPGEWYLDRSGPAHRLYYKPRSDEPLRGSSGDLVVAPRLENLITVAGASGANPVRGLTFRGLRLEETGWTYRNSRGDQEGFVGAQGQLDWNDWKTAPAAAELSYTDGVAFIGCAFRNLGGVGLKLAKGTCRTHIEGNRFSGIGDTGILIYTGRIDPKDTPIPLTDQSRDDVVRNNYLERVGKENLGAGGIALVMAQRATVEHNEVADCPGPGITVGYFTAPLSPAGGSRVQFNYIHDVMQEIDDDGGIYVFHTRFDAPHNRSSLLIYRNFVHGVYRRPQSERYPIAGIYLDEGTRGNIVRQNVVRGVGNWLHLNTGGGPDRETLPERQVLEGNTDANPEWEARAGLEPAYAALSPYTHRKPAPAFSSHSLAWVERRGAKAAGAASLAKAALGNAFSLAMWVKLPADARGDQVLVATPAFRLVAVADGGRVQRVNSEITDGRGTQNSDLFSDASAPNAFPLGRWVHLVVTVDRRHAAHRIYVNGRDVTKTDYFGRPDFVMPVPGQGNAWSTPAAGEFRLYNGPLRPRDIAALASASQRPE